MSFQPAFISSPAAPNQQPHRLSRARCFNVRSLEFIPAHKNAKWIPSGFLARSCTRRQILPLLLHIMSHVSAHILPSHTLSMPHPTPSHGEFHVRHLQTRVVSQGAVCVHSVYPSSRLLFRVVSLLILAVALYIFFYLPKPARDECPPFRFKASLFL
jgi:hypothetical protein